MAEGKPEKIHIVGLAESLLPPSDGMAGNDDIPAVHDPVSYRSASSSSSSGLIFRDSALTSPCSMSSTAADIPK